MFVIVLNLRIVRSKDKSIDPGCILIGITAQRIASLRIIAVMFTFSFGTAMAGVNYTYDQAVAELQKVASDEISDATDAMTAVLAVSSNYTGYSKDAAKVVAQSELDDITSAVKKELDNQLTALYEESKTNITDEIIEGWIDINSNMDDVINDGVIETLEYLKSKEKSLVVLTNWFYKTQKSRLKNSGLLKYFDEIYAGDSALKPNKESYISACGPYSLEECIMIGDDLQKDVYEPSMMGIDSVYYNPNNNYFQSTNKVLSIKNIKGIRERY